MVGSHRNARGVPAIVTAGDRGAARGVYGESKVYLEVAGRPLVAHVVEQLQRVPEVSSVYVVGDPERLGAALGTEALRAKLAKPLVVVPQFENLYQNAWETYRRTLPGAPPEGRDPQTEADRDHQVLYLSGDLPFITPQEISEFVARAQATGCDYAIGLSRERSLSMFHPSRPGGDDGIDVTYFNLREDRLKQSNLHLAKPARILNRHYVQDMYEHRKQRELGAMIGLAWRLLTSEEGGGSIAFFFLLIVIGGWLDRHRLRRAADAVRSVVSIARVERAIARLMRTDVRLVVAETGGCAIDVDTEHEYDVIRAQYARLQAAAVARAAALEPGWRTQLAAEAGGSRAPEEGAP
ncbi:MAG: NTP transferase domain-containing protein [Myxococcota bacterium]